MRRIVALDALAGGVGGLAGYQLRFGQDPGMAHESYGWAALLLPAAWVLAMHAARSYEQRFLWVGAEEFHRVLLAASALVAAVGVVSWALKLDVARGFVAVALPLATLLTLLGRYAQRHALHRKRARGRYQETLVLVGHEGSVSALADELARARHYGYRVIGCCLPARPGAGGPDACDGLPVLGTFDDVAGVVRTYEVDTVAVLPCPELEGRALRQLAWELESTEAALLVAPAITEVAGPRLRIRPIAGLPLLHMEPPELRGVRRLTKEVVDRTAAAVALLFFGPVLLLIAVAVRLGGPGPVLYRQERIGRGGRPFGMLKFRTMVDGADRMLDELAERSEGNLVLFKMRADPRVTPVGRVLRRYSVDELPQLLNVLRGDMSLVGPRPPLPSEVERYGDDMRRRLLVKPGITGLWQVSGRSDLSWEESVRLDISYVENWSPVLDLMIIWKTFRAVLRGSGAY